MGRGRICARAQRLAGPKRITEGSAVIWACVFRRRNPTDRGDGVTTHERTDGASGDKSDDDEGLPSDTAECKMNTKRGRSRSPVEVKDDHSKGSESYGRKENLRDLQNDSHARPGRGHEFVRHSDRHSYGASRESRRHDDYRRYHDKRADDDRSHPRTSRSDRESRADTYYDPSKRDGTSDRSHGDWRNADSRYGGKSVKREQRSKNQEKHESPREYPRHDVTEYDKDADLRKETHSSRRYPEENGSKNKEKFKQDEALKKRSGKEIEKSSCAAEPELETREKRRSLFSSVGPDVENEQHMEMDTSGGIKDETMNDLNAAKVAAMKAAELVNKNIVGFGVGTGRLSTDQKKKLLWGNKKSNPPETSTHWDSNLFSDRERQEKFNKLMGVKSNASASVQESKAGNKDEGPVEVKKQEELDTDLEKLYVAGLRRRDGRTVGLGL